MFNIREDPYELVNIFDQNEALGTEMINDIMAASDAITESEIDVSDATDDATINHPDFPENSRKTTWGWCDATLI